MIKLDAMENPFPLPAGHAQRGSPRGRRGAGQPLSGWRRPRREGGAAAARSHPRLARLDPRQRLRRADPDHHAARGAAGRRDARAGAVVRDVPDRRAVRGMRFVGVPLAAGFRARCRRDAGRDRARAAGARLSRVAEQPDRQPVRGGRRRADPARGARASSSSTRPITRSREASFLPRIAEFPNLVVLRTVSKIGMAGLRLGYAVAAPEWIAELNKVRQPYNLNALTQAVAPVLLAEGEAARRAGACDRRRSARRVEAALAALPGVTVASDARPISCWRGCPMRRAGSTRCAPARILVKNLHGCAPAARALPAHHGRHAGRERRADGGAEATSMTMTCIQRHAPRRSSARPPRPRSPSR